MMSLPTDMTSVWVWAANGFAALLVFLGVRTLKRVDAVEKDKVSLEMHNATVTALREDIKALDARFSDVDTRMSSGFSDVHKRLDRFLESILKER